MYFILCFLILLSNTLLAKPTISVVGAGLAGLTAAYRLEKMGYVVDVYEARGRPGGRVFTVQIGDSYTECGGQNIYDGGEALNISALIEELGLETIECDTAPAQCNYVHEGKAVPLFSVFGKFPKEPTEDLYQSLKEIASHSQNFDEVLTIFSEGDLLFETLSKHRMRGYEGSDCKDLSQFYVDSFWNFFVAARQRAILEAMGEPLEWRWKSVKGGNSTFVKRLEASLSQPIHYHSILKKIAQGKDGLIHLYFADGEQKLSDIVVLALPCSTLRDVEIEENLMPKDQIKAIKTLQYGTNAKILLPVMMPNRPAFSLFTEHGVSWFNQDNKIMTFYYGGTSGLFDSSREEMLNQILKREISTLKTFYPDIQFPCGISGVAMEEKNSYSQPVGISWQKEEFSKGSYSNWAPGQYEFFNEMIEDDCGEIVRKVFRSIKGKIFFAGEHTAIEEPATMEGAVESGERIARMINTCYSIAD